MIRLIRSLCQEQAGPTQQPNLEFVLSRQFDFSHDKQLHDLWLLVRDFSIKHAGALPSIQTLQDMADRKWGVGSKEGEFVKNEVARHKVYLGVDFEALLIELLVDWTLQEVKGTGMTALTRIDALRGTMEPEEVISEVTVEITRALVEAKNKLSSNSTQTEGRITDEEEKDELPANQRSFSDDAFNAPQVGS